LYYSHDGCNPAGGGKNGPLMLPFLA